MNNSPEFQWEHAGVPNRFKSWTWEMLTDINDSAKDIAYKFVEDFPDNEKEGLYLYSKISGTGKSTFSTCLLRDLIASGKTKRTSLFKPFVHLMDEFRASILQGESLISTTLFTRIQMTDLLILDDVGVERMNESVAQRYYMLVDYLWQMNKHVIFTSKFAIGELINRAQPSVETELLESIASRIMGLCRVVRLENDKDFRAI